MIENIEEKRKQLIEIGEVLKKRYHGIDGVIDQIIEKIEVWYTFDDVLYKPTIINLWGMTGCGKTNLIRDLVKMINFYESYCEVDVSRNQMSVDKAPVTNDWKWRRRDNLSDWSIAGRLFGVLDSPEDKGVLLIDEFPKIKTHQENNRFSDVWNLLSDGRLGTGQSLLSTYDNFIEDIEELFTRFTSDEATRMYRDSLNPPREDAFPNPFSNPLKNPNNPNTSPVDMFRPGMIEDFKRIAKHVRIDDLQPIFDFHNFSQFSKYPYGVSNIIYENLRKGIITIDELFNLGGFWYARPMVEIVKKIRKGVADKLSCTTGKDPLVFSKLLVFITGNVDKLYGDGAKDITISANDLHEKTLKLTVDDLKNVLIKEMFTPEEVARLGSNHIIYPSLNQSAFENIITDQLKLIEDDTFKTTNVKVSLRAKKFVDHVYNASVVASQGARPAISGLQTVISTYLPKLVKAALVGKMASISITSFKEFK